MQQYLQAQQSHQQKRMINVMAVRVHLLLPPHSLLHLVTMVSSFNNRKEVAPEIIKTKINNIQIDPISKMAKITAVNKRTHKR